MRAVHTVKATLVLEVLTIVVAETPEAAIEEAKKRPVSLLDDAVFTKEWSYSGQPQEASLGNFSAETHK